MTDIFISYSRKDLAFARLLHQSLKQWEVDTWIDWDRIPGGEDWWREICQAIENAHIFMFIISLSSVNSGVCREEIDQAFIHNKRIIPIIIDDLEVEQVRSFVPNLDKINWIFLKRNHVFQIVENQDVQALKPEDNQVALPKEPQFHEALDKLHETIHTDWEWVKYHTQLQVDARRWETNQKETSYLVRGVALDDAEALLLHDAGKDPQPTALQAEYITASRQDETRRQQAQIRLEQKARQRQRLALWAVGIGFVVALVLGIFAWTQRNEAISQSNTRATAQSIAVSEADSRATAQVVAEAASTQAIANEKTAVAEAKSRATAQAQAEHQTLIAQAGELSAIAVSQMDSQLDLAMLLANEAYLASDSIQNQGNLAKVWMHQPELVRLLFGHLETVWSVAFSPDGKLLASGGRDGEIRFWDAATGQMIGEPLKAHAEGVRAVTFSPDGTLLASAGQDKLVRLWKVDGHRPIGDPLSGHQNWVYSLDFSPDGKLLASGSSDRALFLWDVQTGDQIGDPLLRQKGSITGIDFSPDGSTLVTSSTDGTLQLWDMESREPSGDPIKAHTYWALCVAFSPDGQKLASGGNDNLVKIWDVQSHELVGEPLIGHDNWVWTIAFSPDGARLVSGSLDFDLRIWDPTTGQPLGDPISGGDDVVSIAFSPDGQLLAIGNSSTGPAPVRIYSLNASKNISLQYLDQPQYVKSVKFSPDGRYLASGGGSFVGDDNAIRLAVVGQPQLPPVLFEGHTDWIKSLAFSPDSSTMASAGEDRTIRLWDLESGLPIAVLPVTGEGYPVAILFDKDGELIISVTSNGLVQFWDVRTRQRIGATIGVADDTIKCMALSPDGQLLAYAGYDMEKTSVIRLIKMESREMIASLIGGHTDWILSLDFSPDGKLLASGSGDSSIRLWDVNAGTLVGEALVGHGSPVLGLAFSSSGKILFSGSADSTLRLWSVGSGQPIGNPVTSHNGVVWSLDISPDGQILATGGNDAAVRVWDVTPEAWMDYNCERAGRNLSQAEWERYIYWRPFDPDYRSCPQWPPFE